MVKLYVGNLPFNMNEDSLKEVFTAAGAVEHVKIVTDAYDGRSRGFGFVEMNDESGAKNALDQLNGAEVEGRPIRVDLAKGQSSDRHKGQLKGIGGPRAGGNYRQWE